jgi:hypothetical protein
MDKNMSSYPPAEVCPLFGEGLSPIVAQRFGENSGENSREPSASVSQVWEIPGHDAPPE